MYRGFDQSRLHELMAADVGKRCMIFPAVGKDDWKRFEDGLHDYFQEARQSDPSVGIFGMTEGEATLADALMVFLESKTASTRKPTDHFEGRGDC